jgi:2'-5' RNA ligase
MMPDKIRSFIAIPISKPIKDSIQSIIHILQQKCPNKSIKWVETNNIHLTIKFLGDSELYNLNHLTKQVHNSLEKMRSFDLAFSKLGAFPSIRNPRVLWVGCQINEQITNLYNLIDNICVENGFMSDSKPLSPHITIGRVKNPLSEAVSLQLNDVLTSLKAADLGSQQINNFFLYKSELTRGGPIYSPIDEFILIS